MFSRTSRYRDVPDGICTDRTGRQIAYKRLRLIPSLQAQLTHTVRDGERLDLLGLQYYNDPEQFWRICDANLALQPDDLVAVPGRRLLIALMGL